MIWRKAIFTGYARFKHGDTVWLRDQRGLCGSVVSGLVWAKDLTDLVDVTGFDLTENGHLSLNGGFDISTTIADLRLSVPSGLIPFITERYGFEVKVYKRPFQPRSTL